MVQVSFPGVYIREVSSGVRTITGVATSITAFIGEAKGGVMFEPTRVLGFTDYERIFSSDTSLGEMTDQVRQFFLNGGSQAVIVRVADGAVGGGITLDSSNQAAVLTLRAKSAGTASNSLRASVDYKSAAPERLFNLRVYREQFDASGNPQAVEEELFRDLSMDSSSLRFVGTILAQQSAHVTATVPTLTKTPGFSASGRLFADQAATKTAIQAAIAATTSGTVGMFRIKYGSEPFREVTVLGSQAAGAGAAAGLDAIRNGIVSVLNLGAGAVTVAHDVANGPIVIRAAASTSPGAPNVDLVIERAPVNDISVALQLGVAQGGLEVSATSDDRPAPNGFISQIGPVTGTEASQLNTLLEFANQAPNALNQITVTGAKSFTVSFNLAGPGGATMDQIAPGGDRNLTNVAMRLQLIADAVNADANASQNWRAEVHGFRLALIPRFGDANAGVSHTIASAGGYAIADNAGTKSLYGDVIANVAAYSLGIGSLPVGGFQTVPSVEGIGTDGNVPSLNDYRRAFEEIDRKVDLFNLMVLPESARDETRRALIWGAASAFCQRRRAFLVVDYGPEVTTVDLALSSRTALRAGVVKDHAAVFWPPIKIPAAVGTKTIDPSGSVAGVMSRIDSTRGVWKAPAGLEADLRGVLAVGVPMSDPENGLLNPEAINAIRSFPNGVVVWGSRTMDGFDNSGNDDYKYVPVRRFTLFIEESLYRGVKFAVFEPNAEPLWSALRTAVGAFMNNLFRQGAFAGKTTREAYFVKVDAETTTQNDINLGIVNVVVGFAPLKPAEFVVITIKQQAGQVQV